MKRIVWGGASQRSLGGYAKKLLEDLSDKYEICGIFDIDHDRNKAIMRIHGHRYPAICRLGQDVVC